VTEQLEKLVAVDKSARDMEQLRYVTLKMCQLLQTQGLTFIVLLRPFKQNIQLAFSPSLRFYSVTDKGKKEILSKICEKAAVLLSLLEVGLVNSL
jgi:hypothetical protein